MTIARGLVALFLIPSVGLLHFLLATKFEIYEKRPAWGIIIILACLIVLGRLLIRSNAHRKVLVVLNLIGWMLALITIWWIEVFTQYPPLNSNHKEGQKIVWSNQEQLKGRFGQPFDIDSVLQEAENTLLIFYRGHW